MSKQEYLLRILTNEVKKCKAHVGAALVDAVSKNEDVNYRNVLNEVLTDLDSVISKLEVILPHRDDLGF